ncbi:hypothetical protein JCM3765_004189 [Sporobolomyces pararoseus]
MENSLQDQQQALVIVAAGEAREIVDRHARNEGGPDEIQTSSTGEGDGTETEPSAKRIKTDATTSEEQSTPSQAKPVDIPFDLWLMVGDHLEPLDLLHLTRVNKPLRRLLRSKSDSAQVWKRAYKRIEFPTLKATDWDLIYLASFLFEDLSCFGCGTSNGTVLRDFPSRIFVHEHCRSTIFSTATEVSDLVDVLHPDTLSCVASWSIKQGRKVQEFYIPSEVQAMNNYLHHLESATTASRDRQLRKAARETRDGFIASKKKCIEARFEDGTTMRLWLHSYQTREREAAQQRREQERAVRLQERLSNIRSRLLSLGHQEKDLKWLEKDLSVTKDQVLTESGQLIEPFALHQRLYQLTIFCFPEWSEISASLIELAVVQKTKREQDERDALEARLLSNYYSFFDKSSGLSLFCSLKDFNNIQEVKQLVEARSEIGDLLWNQILPSLRERFDKSRRQTKLSYARPLAHALAKVGHPLPQEVFESLFPPGASLMKPVGYWIIPLKPDYSSDDGSTISEAEIDTLLSRFTSKVFCGFFDRHRAESFSEVVVLRRGYSHPSGVSVSAQWIKLLFSILKRTGIEDGDAKETLSKLERLGKVWRCKTEHWWNNKPEPFMTYSELMRHLSDDVSHARALNPHYSQGSYPISSIVYAPQPAVAGSSSTT